MTQVQLQSLIRSANDHFRAGRFNEAAEAYSSAIAAGADQPEIHDNLGMVLSKLGRLESAIVSFRAALRLRPNDLYAGINLGNALAALGLLPDALNAYRQLLAYHPGAANAHYNLGRALYQLGRLDESIVAFREAVSLDRSHAEAHASLGNALKDSGRLDEALAEYRRAIEAKPHLIAAHSNYLYSIYFHPGFDAHAILLEHRRFNDQFAAPFAKQRTNSVGSASRTDSAIAEITIRGAAPAGAATPGFAVRTPDPTRASALRLRIGYISPDFRAHCNAHFTLPLLSAHDRTRFELYCYSDVSQPDDVTEKLRSHTDRWRSIVGMSDEQAAEIIAKDQIDILVDLTLHMAKGRPLLFARKPAPVQVTWLGYPGTTGLSAMDYRLSDPYLDPLGLNDDCYVEKTIRLPDTYWCYDPMNTDLAVAPLAAKSNGRITFGCLNNFCKVNDGVLEMFAGVLRAVENSRLILLAPAGETRQRVLQKFQSESIAADRIEFVDRRPWRTYMELYHQIDIALDTFPWNGHTTSLDGLWMGVPVVTLSGPMPVSRGGLSLLSNLGLRDLVAQTPEQYINIARDGSSDLPRLAELRATLRQRMERSALMDKTRFARNVEAAYAEMWRISGLK